VADTAISSNSRCPARRTSLRVSRFLREGKGGGGGGKGKKKKGEEEGGRVVGPAPKTGSLALQYLRSPRSTVLSQKEKKGKGKSWARPKKQHFKDLPKSSHISLLAMIIISLLCIVSVREKKKKREKKEGGKKKKGGGGKKMERDRGGLVLPCLSLTFEPLARIIFYSVLFVGGEGKRGGGKRKKKKEKEHGRGVGRANLFEPEHSISFRPSLLEKKGGKGERGGGGKKKKKAVTEGTVAGSQCLFMAVTIFLTASLGGFRPKERKGKEKGGGKRKKKRRGRRKMTVVLVITVMVAAGGKLYDPCPPWEKKKGKREEERGEKNEKSLIVASLRRNRTISILVLAF